MRPKITLLSSSSPVNSKAYDLTPKAPGSSETLILFFFLINLLILIYLFLAALGFRC